MQNDHSQSSDRRRSLSSIPSAFLCVLCVSVVNLFAAGCVQRTITITSDPPGALVWLNDREIGRTPLDVNFVYYGT